MPKTLELKVEQDHVESLAKGKPLVAIEELIWNGLDADATRIRVTHRLNRLSGLTEIRVTDNGTGIPREDCERAFGSLGGSAKLRRRTTTGGRAHHGKSGKGRFRAFAIGRTVTWTSRCRLNGVISEFHIKGSRTSLRTFEIGDAKPSKSHDTGVDVTISDIERSFPTLLDDKSAADQLAQRLALYLRKYPGIEIFYGDQKVDPKDLEAFSATYPIFLKDERGEDVEAELTIIEWKSPLDRALYLCDDDGFALEELAPGIQARGFHFTAYLKSSLVAELFEGGAFALEELHPIAAGVLDCAKEVLRDHFRAREASRSIDLVKQWQEEKVYPYEPSEQDPLKRVEREVFDVCAVKVHEYLPSFERSDPKTKLLTFRLIREALESNPHSLQTILRQVLELPQEQQNDLAAILGRTHLAALINAAKTVVDRLDFVASLDCLLFGEFRKTLLERRQLHRILAEELWIFGEQYTLAVDDQSLTEVLKKHVKLLGRDDLAPEQPEVTDLDERRRVVDLMLHRTIPQSHQDNFEQLVIELKRPSCKLGQDELGQIENYAFSIADDERFDKSRTRWTFLLIGNELTPFADRKCREQGRPYGHIHASADGAVNIFVKKWSTVISEAKWRYEFFRRKLECQVTTSDGLTYLRSKYGQRLPTSAAQEESSSIADGNGTGPQY